METENVHVTIGAVNARTHVVMSHDHPRKTRRQPQVKQSDVLAVITGGAQFPSEVHRVDDASLHRLGRSIGRYRC
jgi:hypothetical protein